MKNNKNWCFLIVIVLTSYVGYLSAVSTMPAPSYDATLYYSDEKGHAYDGRDPLYRQKLKGYYSFKANQKYATTSQWHHDTYRPWTHAFLDHAAREKEYIRGVEKQGEKMVQDLGQWDGERSALMKESAQKEGDEATFSKEISSLPVRPQKPPSSLPMVFMLFVLLSLMVGVLLSRKRAEK